jgi:opacity protein-like surface antigen
MKKHFLLILLCFSVMSLQAQNSLNVDFFLGTSNYSGDLQEKRFTFSQAHLAGGIGLSYELTNQFSLRTAFKLGKVSADDSKGRNKSRNLNFSSMISEGDVDLQYFFSPLGTNPLTPYGFIGIAVYHFSPYTFDSTGQKYFLKPLSTEGEGFINGRPNYSLTQLAIPFGAGVKLSLSDNINVGFEIGIRKLFTDYLDDVSTAYVDPNLLLANRGAKAVELSYRGDELKGGSQTYPRVGQIRGSPNYKDWYYFTGLTMSFRLGNDFLNNAKEHYKQRRVKKHSQWDCPRNVL